MTVNEQQELAVLQIFITHKIERFSSITFPDELRAALGSGAGTIVKNLIRDGLITDLMFSFEYEFNEAGKARYILLKKKKESERLRGLAFWVIFVCTLIAAGDVVCNRITIFSSKPLQPLKPNQEKIQPKQSPSQISQADTIKVHHTIPSDSLKKH
jgi:hypothetical protein